VTEWLVVNELGKGCERKRSLREATEENLEKRQENLSSVYPEY
jgi:hypothetical protein